MRRAAIEEQNRLQLERQRQFRRAADVIVAAWTGFPEIHAVAVIGSVAVPLWKEVPRFDPFRRAGIEVWHECGDLDLAVWIDSQHRLRDLRRASDLALRDAQKSAEPLFVASHQLDAFLFEPATDRYLGRLCAFNRCPKDKPDCRVPGCGDTPFNRHFPHFRPRDDLLASAALLYVRGVGLVRSATELPTVVSPQADAADAGSGRGRGASR